MAREVVVLSAVRTAVGSYGGCLKDIPPSELAAKCVKEAVRRAGIKSADVGHVVFGNVIHTDAHDHYLARVAGVKGGLPVYHRWKQAGIAMQIPGRWSSHARALL